jgi:hypothetical protein
VARLPSGPLAVVDRALARLDGQSGCVVFFAASGRVLLVLSGTRLCEGRALATVRAIASAADLIDLILIQDGRWQSLLCESRCCTTAQPV